MKAARSILADSPGSGAATPGCGCGDAACGAPPRAHTRAGRWSTAAAVVSCAVCPACLSAYTKHFSTLGVGVWLSETAHDVLLFVALAINLLSSAIQCRQQDRTTPLGISLAGCFLVTAGHLQDVPGLEWLGLLTLVAGGTLERATWRLKHGAVHQPAAPSP